MFDGYVTFLVLVLELYLGLIVIMNRVLCRFSIFVSYSLKNGVMVISGLPVIKFFDK